MKSYFIGAVLVLVVFTLAAAATDAQVGRIQIKQQLQTSDGGPIVMCRPGVTCPPNDQVRQMASDGGPIVMCRPGVTCPPNDQVRQMASDGGPIVMCRPGVTCPPNDQLRQMASDGGNIPMGWTYFVADGHMNLGVLS